MNAYKQMANTATPSFYKNARDRLANTFDCKRDAQYSNKIQKLEWHSVM